MPVLKPAEGRYLLRLFIAMAVYVAVLFAVNWVFHHSAHPPQGPLAYLLAALPALPVIGGIGVMGYYLVDEKDEFERMVLVKAMLWAIGVTLSAVTLIESIARFVPMDGPPLFSAFTLFVVTFGVAASLVRWGYK
jgi:hypothetical protein